MDGGVGFEKSLAQRDRRTLARVLTIRVGNDAGRQFARLLADGMTAVTIILAMSCGVIVPKLAIDRLTDSATRSKS